MATVIPSSLDGRPRAEKTMRRGWRRFVERHLPNISIFLMVLTLFIAVLYPSMLITVPAGHVGVLWKRFSGPGIYCWCILHRGTVLNPEELREEGLHVIWPWDILAIYDLRLQSRNETYNTISRDGVSVVATINVRGQLKHDSVAVLHKFIGPDYAATAVRPEVGSRAREVIAKYTAEEVYSTKRQQIEDEIRVGVQRSLGPHLNKLVQPQASEQVDAERYKDALANSIEILDTLVLGIELPPAIVGAINRKTEQYYMVQEYTFRVEREQKESERKQIEANGIQAFQRTVSQGISESYLRWRGIEATLQLSQSPNSKIVIIGSGKDGVPIILGNVDTPQPAAAPAGAAPPATAPTSATDSATAGKQPAPGASTPSAPTTPGAPATGPSTPGAPAGTPATSPSAAGTEKTPVASGPSPPTAGAGTSPTTPPSPSTSSTGATSPSAGKPEEPAPFSPLTLSDIESFLSRLARMIRSVGSEESTAPRPPAETPAPAPAR